MLPYFYHGNIQEDAKKITLEESSSKHIIQVLRKKIGDTVLLTDGKGQKAEAVIEQDDRKRCIVKIISTQKESPRICQLSIGIAFTKNKTRNEWFLEKATELGIENIYPIITERTEKEKFNFERYNQILISSVLQSQQCFLPQLHEIQKLGSFLSSFNQNENQNFIAHCLENEEKASLLTVLSKQKSSFFLIGPEGDFSPKEIEECISNGFFPLSLGQNRLRTETAGIYAAAVFNAFHYG